MKQLIQKSFAILALFSLALTVNAAGLNREKVKSLETELATYMHATEASLNSDLQQMEATASNATSTLDKLKSAIFFHEVSAQLGKEGYAQKSYDILSELSKSADTESELMPFVTAYEGSAQVLLGQETGKKSQIRKGIKTLTESVDSYRKYSYVSRFLRGTALENVGLRKSIAREDFTMLIVNYEFDNSFSNAQVMSLAYTGWASLHQEKVYREKAISYLEKAISLDPQGISGKDKAQSLLKKLG